MKTTKEEKLEEREKRVFQYQIFTTNELGETIYSALKIKIIGTFVKFAPFSIKTSLPYLDAEKNMILILPERVIVKIRKVDVTEEMKKELSKLHRKKSVKKS
jgi:hypothetical protein